MARLPETKVAVGNNGTWGTLFPSIQRQTTPTKLGELCFQASRGRPHRRNLGNSFSKCSEANDTDETWGTLLPSVQRQTTPTKLGELFFRVFRGKRHHPCFDYFESTTTPIVESSEKIDERKREQTMVTPTISRPQPAADETLGIKKGAQKKHNVSSMSRQSIDEMQATRKKPREVLVQVAAIHGRTQADKEQRHQSQSQQRT